jgi:chromosome segregation ATPase
MLGAQGGDVQGSDPSGRGRGWPLHSSPYGKIKHSPQPFGPKGRANDFAFPPLSKKIKLLPIRLQQRDKNVPKWRNQANFGGNRQMSDIQELERRINAALERIGQAVDNHTPKVASPAAAPADDGRLSALAEELQAERDANAQLHEKLRLLNESDSDQVGELQEKVETLTRQLDAQGLEVKRMRKNVIHLRETMRGLREAQSRGVTEPHLLNKAMLAELEALRATRLSETAEMDEILAELKPLIGDMQDA